MDMQLSEGYDHIAKQSRTKTQIDAQYYCGNKKSKVMWTENRYSAHNQYEDNHVTNLTKKEGTQETNPLAAIHLDVEMKGAIPLPSCQPRG